MRAPSPLSQTLRAGLLLACTLAGAQAPVPAQVQAKAQAQAPPKAGVAAPLVPPRPTHQPLPGTSTYAGRLSLGEARLAITRLCHVTEEGRLGGPRE